MTTDSKSMHPGIHQLKRDLQNGALSRRAFLRYASLLGLSTGTAYALSGLPLPKNAWAASPQRGGVLKVACQIQKITHPAQFSWIMPSNILRQVAEYLTWFGADNITKPMLLSSWNASEDLKTWTLNLRQGVTWNNGDRFVADDVVFTFNQWLDKEVKSSMYGLIGGYLDPSGVEKVDDHTVRLHLKRPEIALPEHLFHYPAMVLHHKSFEGDFLRAPVGTGPYTLETYKEGEVAILKARKDYWQKGVDGKPLPYLDGMQFIDLGGDLAPQIAALKSGEVHMIDASDNPGPVVMKSVKSDAHIQVLPVTTGTTRVLRMRVDQKPFSDNRVRLALKLCQNREKILALAFEGEGMQGQDTHVYPSHPEYCQVATPAYDPSRAKQLLAEAGYPKGLAVDLAVASEWTDVVRYAEVLKQDALPAGIRINIKTMPTSQYWEKWTEVPLGITPWTHRPLGTMILNLAYIADEEGKPVSWNETRWVDPEFSELLVKANGTLDVEARRQIFCELEKIQQERGSIGIAYWMNSWMCASQKLKQITAHPNLYMLFNEAWLES
ncbi:MAG: ABC transporter substrate-binding protein [Desulfosarcinaceae bacterium]|nr:ABC transporter substrate-binding protein [Desulfosarcinaceae bacterium]